METKNCQNCESSFQIDERDQDYYKKINVPVPTWCPQCRLIRRTSMANSWSLFWRNCDKCSKRTLSAYPPSQKIIVYCQPCWWADDWDGTEYGVQYDSSRPFLEQVKELSEKTPYCALETTYLTLKDCEYSNGLAYSKNCLLATWADYCENVCFSSFLNGAKDTADSLRIKDSELIYESIGQQKGYRVFYSEECDGCTDVWFSRNCYGCTNCVGCVNLRGASYRIFNVQYSKEEYAEKIKELQLDTRGGINKIKKEAEIFWQKLPYREYSGNTLNVNVTGEYVYESKNSKDMYLCTSAEDCRYCQFSTVAKAKDCVDYSGWGNGAESMYECANVGDGVSNSKFSYYCFPDVLNTEYSFWCIAPKNNFGCVNLKRKKYAILNKEYSKEEYESLRVQIIKDMANVPYTDALGRIYPYGEFFPATFSKFAYNNSNASKFFPKTKQESLAQGYFWNDEEEQIVSETCEGASLPETISEITADILKEVISCSSCPRKYRIAALELDILRKLNIPLPTSCPKCREGARFEKIHKPFSLRKSSCGNCQKEIQTPFSQEESKNVFCVDCYQRVVE